MCACVANPPPDVRVCGGMIYVLVVCVCVCVPVRLILKKRLKNKANPKIEKNLLYVCVCVPVRTILNSCSITRESNPKLMHLNQA